MSLSSTTKTLPVNGVLEFFTAFLLMDGSEDIFRLSVKKMTTYYKDRQQTWTLMLDRVARLAEGLPKACRRLAEGLQKLGMKSEDRVALLSLHSDRLIEYFFAVVWAAER
jgi:long-subunit acyl-CoA synthetase (AMP-forming)